MREFLSEYKNKKGGGECKFQKFYHSHNKIVKNYANLHFKDKLLLLAGNMLK